MAYAYANLSDAQGVVSRRLYDTAQNMWPPAELTAYIQEALQTWNALTGFWRANMTFSSVANNANVWYDVTQVAGTVRPMTTTDNQLIQLIEYHLLEPLTSTYPLTWTGSNQYSVQDILDALGYRWAQLLSMTGCTVTRQLVASNPTAPQFAVPLGNNVVDIRRVAWVPNNNAFPVTPLYQTDDWSLMAYNPLYAPANAAVPSQWRVTAQAPLTFATDTNPPQSANFEVLSINSPVLLSASANNTMNIPNDWCWVLKFGALVDLFEKDGLARDDVRSDYCRQRWRQGLGLLTDAPAILSGFFGAFSSPLIVDAVRNADDFNPTWQSANFAAPQQAYTCGLNLLALSPPANVNGTGVTLNVVENAPLPVNSTDPIQLGQDDFDVVMGYAAHLATLKVGGQEFTRTISDYNGMVRRAALYNSKLQALGFYQKDQIQISQLQEEREPVYSTVTPANVDQQ